jgi:hypothetical protein
MVVIASFVCGFSLDFRGSLVTKSFVLTECCAPATTTIVFMRLGRGFVEIFPYHRTLKLINQRAALLSLPLLKLAWK